MKSERKAELGWRVWALFAVFCALVAGTLSFWMMGSGLSDMKAVWQTISDFLTRQPWAIFCALVVLPGLPFPTSALFVIAGVVWKDRPVMACALCMAAIAANMSWTYWLAAGIGRKLVLRLLTLTRFEMPDYGRESDLRIILILRLVPGFPLFLQNYILGLLHVPFRLYLPVSVVCNGVMACGVVLSSAGISSGKIGPAISGVSVLIVAVIGLKWIRGRMVAKKAVGGGQ